MMAQIEDLRCRYIWLGLPLGIHPLRIDGQVCPRCDRKFSYNTLAAWTMFGWSVQEREFCGMCIGHDAAL